jgi:hypothetical protein
VDDALRLGGALLRGADLAPRSLLSSLSTLLPGPFRDREIRSSTGISRRQWQDLGRAFPLLGPDPGPDAARARRRFDALLGRAFSDGRDAPAFRDAPPSPEPCVYATGHIGDLRGLRYLLRFRIAVATVVNEDAAHRATRGRRHLDVEERVPRDFPHVLPSSSPHGLRSALRRGSLIVTADLPSAGGNDFSCLGGVLRLDPRPFRLARLAGTPCRPIFLTAPEGVLTITIGPALLQDEAGALAGFASAFERAAEETPFDIDGVTWWNRLERR